MTRSKKKANRNDRIDRISDLPSNVIDAILEHLNIVDLVKTSILSRKWRYMWMSVQQLVFKRDFFIMFEHLDDPGPEASRIISKILLLHNGPIYKFTLFLPRTLNFTIRTECISKWILFLSTRGIKYLELQNDVILSTEMLPSHIFSCQELRHFRLCRFSLTVPPNFCGFKSLLDLNFQQIILRCGTLESLISGCPSLEKLSIELVQDMKPICLEKVKNLIDLTLTISRECSSGLIKSLPKIQRLAVQSCYQKRQYADIISPTQLISLTHLKFGAVNFDERTKLLYIVSVLKSASNLVELIIESNYHNGEPEPDQPEELQCNSCCLSQLQTANIKVGSTFKHALSLIRFILANASSLKTLTFSVDFDYKKVDAPLMFRISQDLLWMKRASQRARVEFLYS
ncbi:F-box/FBD/LRR-repeat protein At1g13570-like [Cicer arietinum]|uniref:F-box/FBD/LRR-repeat protein At1g13570-like n=1 Tax=Cicer arietinum TaxID=3827 RepID=A0A1S2XL39_CICAR|nr:F-box/FBD/LRR-repeat protein At1g13570-like [Cicer arietinum]